MKKPRDPMEKRIVYYPYVPTFNEDSSREQKGIGSLNGITEKLPYLKALGVNIVWPSPFCASPMQDGGYDTTNQKAINPEFGTMSDAKNLIDGCHENGMQIIMDYIANHTHIKHPWFQDSRARQKGYEDFFWWHPGKVDKDGNRVPPNNWPSRFSEPNLVKRKNGGFPELGPNDPTPAVPMWQWDDDRGEYYMRTYIKEQADLNWNNPDVVSAQLDVMRYWREMGMDGFRIDGSNHMAKNPALTDEKRRHDYDESTTDNPMEQWTEEHYCNYWPLLKRYITQMCDLVESTPGEDPLVLLEAYAEQELLDNMSSLRPHLATTFNFVVMCSKWDAQTRKHLIDEYMQNLPAGAFPNFVNSNMDNSRTASVLGDAQARSAGLMNVMLPGLTIIHNGDELGLHDGNVPDNRIKDPNGFRDNYRTPMIWDDSLPNAGFSRAPESNLYLPINNDDLALSAERQRNNPKSILRMYQAAIQLANENEAIYRGRYVRADTDNGDVYSFVRSLGGEHAFVMTNFSDQPQVARVKEALSNSYKSVISSVDVLDNKQKDINLSRGFELQPNESIVLTPKS